MKKTFSFLQILFLTSFVLLFLNSFSLKGFINLPYENRQKHHFEASGITISDLLVGYINNFQISDNETIGKGILQNGYYFNEINFKTSYLCASDTDSNSFCKYKIFETAIAHDTLAYYRYLEICRSVKYLPDTCGFIVAANYPQYYNEYRSNMELLKLRANSSVIWNYMYNNNEYQSGYLNDVEVTSDNGYVSCGWIRDDQNYTQINNLVVLKTDVSGSPQWSCQSALENNDELNDIIQTYDDNYVAVGFAIYNYMKVPLVIKLDPYGNKVWANIYIPNHDNIDGVLYSVREVKDANNQYDGYIISGYNQDQYNYTDLKDVLVMRINEDGTIRWSKIVPRLYNQEGRNIVETTVPGKYAVTGYTDTNSWTNYNKDLLLMFFDENNFGAGIQYNRITGNGNSIEDGFAMELIDNTELVISGIKTSNSGDEDVLLLKADYNANVIWSKLYGDTIYSDSALCVATYLDITGNRYIAFAGLTKHYFPSSYDDDYYIVNTNAYGNTGCNRNVNLITINETEEFTDMDYTIEKIEINPINLDKYSPPFVQDTCDGDINDSLYGCKYKRFETEITHDTSSLYLAEECRSIKFVPDSCGFIVAGDALSNNPSMRNYMELIKLKENTTISWIYRYYFDEYKSGSLFDVEVTQDKGYVSCGWIWDDNNLSQGNNMVVLKTDYLGAPQWSTRSLLEGGDELADMIQTHDGYYVAVGNAHYNGTLTPMIVKLNGSGNKIWSYIYNPYEQFFDGSLYSVREIIDSNGLFDGYITCGYYNTRSYSNYDVLIMRINDDGTLRWSKIIPKFDFQEGRSIVQTSTPGLFAVTGFTDSIYSGWNYNRDLLFITFNENNLTGNLQYDKIVKSQNSSESGYAIELVDNNSLVISGAINDMPYNWYNDALLLTLNYSGSIYWSNIYGIDNNNDSARSVATYLDNAGDRFYAFAGITTKYLPNHNDGSFYIVNTDVNGATGCEQSIQLTTIHDTATFLNVNFELIDFDLHSLEMRYFPPINIQDTCDGTADKSDKHAAPEGKVLNEDNKSLKIYPVPLYGDKILNLDFLTQEIGNVKVTLYSSFGKSIIETSFKSLTGLNKYKLQMGNLSSGLYYIKFTDGKTEFSSKIIIIQ
jgi:hypothetical protein